MGNLGLFAIPLIMMVVTLPLTIYLVMVVARRSSEKQKAALTNLAGRMGLQLVELSSGYSWMPPKYELKGELDGVPARVFRYTVGSGRNSTTYHTARLLPQNPGNLEFQFSRENVFHKLGKAMGMQDVQLGDPRIDPHLMIKANDPGYLKAALVEEIRDQIAQFYTTERSGPGGVLRLDTHGLRYDETGGFLAEKSAQRAEDAFTLLRALLPVVEVYGAGE